MNKNTNKCRFFILTKNHACKIPLGVGKLHHFLTASAEKCNFSVLSDEKKVKQSYLFLYLIMSSKKIGG